MRTAMKLSVLLNLGLVSALVWLLSGESKPASGSAAPPEAQNQVPQAATVPRVFASPVVEGGAPAPFRWSQLESKDYRVYIKNLRAIGCPGQTIRDIITADVDSLYKARSRELREKLAALANGPLSECAGTEPGLVAELNKLPGEENAVIAGLLGIQTVSQNGAEDAPAPTRAPRRRPPVEGPISVPVVLTDVDLASLHFDASRIQVIDSLRQRFIEELGGPGQDPSDPAYRERWQKAQPEIDGMLKGMIGINAYQEYDLAARANLHRGTAGRQ
jgi:hypothetical protein